MLKGLALTPPVIGRISIGKVVERDGLRLPEKDDEFTITSQVQTREGWVPHPLDQTLRQTAASGDGQSASQKLRAIPVRLLFDDPDLSLRASYTLFERRSGRPLCVGDGENCRRVTPKGIESLPCPAPEGCELGHAHCKPLGRLNVRIGDEDELGSFIFRTAGYNSIRTLATRLKYFHAASHGRLSTLPLELRLRGKSTAGSHRTPIYYVDLTLRTGSTLIDALTAAESDWHIRDVAGFDQEGLDKAAREGFALGAFEESVEEGGDVVEEFYPAEHPAAPVPAIKKANANTHSLAEKLGERLTGASTGDPKFQN